MRRTFFRVMAMVAGVGLLAGVALADHATSKKGNVFKAELMTAYSNCGFPGEGFSTDPPGLILASCTPVRLDPVCGFQVTGGGKLLAKVATNATTGIKDDIQIKVSLSKLSSGCVGSTLTAVASANATSDDCSASPASGGSCTVVNELITNFAVGTCVVDTKGGCKITTTVNKFGGGTVIEAGNRLSLEVRDTRIKRGIFTSFTPGLLVP